MAEPVAAGSPVSCNEEPMAIRLKASQPENSDAAPAPAAQTPDNAGSGGSRVAQDGAISDDQASQSGSGAGAATTGILPAVDRSDEPTGDTAAGKDVAVSADTQPKAKKPRKRTKKRRKNVSGFEEYYADAPMTPAEALEEKRNYCPSRPFSDRIEECIQRYRARRRLDDQRGNMFNKYLFLGGIDGSPRQFTGMTDDKDAMDEADNDQIRTMTAVDFIGGRGDRFYDGRDLENWEVDFEAIVKGFLSRTIPDCYMFDVEANEMASSLVKNFLNYIIMHDVCPEYTDQILAARHVCDIAPIELRHMHELSLELPGNFNSAACRLFYEGNVKHLDKDDNCKTFTQFRLTAILWSLSEKAKRARDEILKIEDPTKIEIVSTTEETYEVLEIKRPRRKHKKTVDEQLANMYPDCKSEPAGILRVRPAIIAHGWGNMPRPEEVDFSDCEHEEFVLEDELLAKFEVGMKLHMTVCQLNVGIRFIKEIHDIRVSFDTFLPQYLMTNWKEPVVNNRPPPSVHDLKTEQRGISIIQADDLD